MQQFKQLNYTQEFHKYQTLKGHKGAVYVSKFSKDGLYCLTGSLDRSLALWNPFKGSVIKTYQGPHNLEILDIAISRDNNRFASVGGDKNAFIWDVATAKIIRKFTGHDSRINTCCYNADESILATGSYDGTVKIWDLKSSSYMPIDTLKIFKDSVTKVICGTDRIYTSSVDGYIRTFDLAAGEIIQDNLYQGIHSFDLSYNENLIAASCLDNTIKLLERSTGEIIQEYSGHMSNNYHIDCRISNDGSFIVSGSEDGYFYIYEILKKQYIQKIKAHDRVVSSVDISPKNNSIVLGSFDNTVSVWSQN